MISLTVCSQHGLHGGNLEYADLQGMQVVKSSTATKRILLVSWAANACSKDAEHKAIQSRVGSNRSTEGQSKTGHLPHFLPFLDLYTDKIGSDIFFSWIVITIVYQRRLGDRPKRDIKK